MRPTKMIDPAALATLTTGTLLMKPLTAVHEAAEWLTGEPVHIHGLPALLPGLRDAVLAQYPDMPTACTRDQCEATLRALRERYGDRVAVAGGPRT